MKCPNCEHVADDKSLVKCSKCGEAFERGMIEELSHLDYLQSVIQEREQELGNAAADLIQKYVLTRKGEILDLLKPPEVEPTLPPTPEPVAAIPSGCSCSRC